MSKNFKSLKVGNWYHVLNASKEKLLCVNKEEDIAEFARREEAETICLEDYQLENEGFSLLTKEPVPIIQAGSDDGNLLM